MRKIPKHPTKNDREQKNIRDVHANHPTESNSSNSKPDNTPSNRTEEKFMYFFSPHKNVILNTFPHVKYIITLFAKITWLFLCLKEKDLH